MHVLLSVAVKKQKSVFHESFEVMKFCDWLFIDHPVYSRLVSYCTLLYINCANFIFMIGLANVPTFFFTFAVRDKQAKSRNKFYHIAWNLLLQTLTDFKNSFTDRLSRKFAIHRHSPHLTYVTTTTLWNMNDRKTNEIHRVPKNNESQHSAVKYFDKCFSSLDVFYVILLRAKIYLSKCSKCPPLV